MYAGLNPLPSCVAWLATIFQTKLKVLPVGYAMGIPLTLTYCIVNVQLCTVNVFLCVLHSVNLKKSPS